MNSDLVFPNKNEDAFLERAEKLGYQALIFAYEKKEHIPQKRLNHEKIKIFSACLEKVKNADLIIAEHSDKDRERIERKEIQLLYHLETDEKRDFLHQRASGLNHILAELCSEKKVMVSFSHNLLLKSKKRALLLGRMMQNIGLCRKYKVPMVFASFASAPIEMRSPHDLKALGIVLGMHPSEAKECLSSLYEYIATKK